MPTPSPVIEGLAAEINRLSPADRLRLAADLLERKRPNLAHTIAEKVVLELGAVLALGVLRAEDPKGGG